MTEQGSRVELFIIDLNLVSLVESSVIKKKLFFVFISVAYLINSTYILFIYLFGRES